MSSFWYINKSTISNSQVFLLKKYAICNGQNFFDTLTKDIDSFEQLAPGYDEVPEDNKYGIYANIFAEKM